MPHSMPNQARIETNPTDTKYGFFNTLEMDESKNKLSTPVKAPPLMKETDPLSSSIAFLYDHFYTEKFFGACLLLSVVTIALVPSPALIVVASLVCLLCLCELSHFLLDPEHKKKKSPYPITENNCAETLSK